MTTATSENRAYKKIGDVCVVIAGQSPEGKYYNTFGKGLPFYQGKKEFTDKYIGEPTTWTTEVTKEAVAGDILMSVRAPVGPINYATQKICIGRGLAAIRPTQNIDPEYLFYFLIKIEREIVGNAGAVFASINKSQIESISIPLPPLPEQKRIVAILDEAFAAIATAKENAEKNLKNARELFESYLQSVFANPGDGWEEKSFAEVCEISSKLVDPREAEFIEMCHVGGANIEGRTGALLDLKTAREEKLISGKFVFDDSMVLYSKIRPYLIKVTRPDFSGLCSADIYPLKPMSNEVTRDFLYYLLISDGFTRYAIAGSARAGMPKVNREHLFAFRLKRPRISEQMAITIKLDRLSEEAKKLESIYQKKLANLEELKKSILQKAFNGELKGLST